MHRDTIETTTLVTIDVFADVVCPWCWIGEQRLAKALAERPALAVERRWRPFQLQPEMPPGGRPWSEIVREKFGGEVRAREMFAQVARVGTLEGLDFRFDRITRAPNTTDAHRLILLARRHEREWPVAESLFRAHFAEGVGLDDPEELVRLAMHHGIPETETRALLAGDELADDVVASQRKAQELGIGGVPFFVIDGRFGISGAQSSELFVRALDMASERERSD